MRLALSPADEAFRREVRAFLDTALTDELREAGRTCTGIYNDRAEAGAWLRILDRQGWAVPRWPVEWGGAGWTPIQHYLFTREQALAHAPRIAPNAVGMVAPVILAFGTEQQKAAYLPSIKTGEDWWAQGYSEPEAGSDLASLQCAAKRGGDHYVVNGSKIWTSHGQSCNKIFCLVRTRQGGRPQAGISFLLFDMNLPGITLRPVRTLSGEPELNQIFFDNVRVPASGLLGNENDGWTIAKYLLQHERSSINAPKIRARLDWYRRIAEQKGDGHGGRLIDDPAIAMEMAALECRLAVLEVAELDVVTRGADSALDATQASRLKIEGSELRQRATELGLDLLGRDASCLMLELGEDAPFGEDGPMALATYFTDRAISVAAGSNEIQRNIIAHALLGAQQTLQKKITAR